MTNRFFKNVVAAALACGGLSMTIVAWNSLPLPVQEVAPSDGDVAILPQVEQRLGVAGSSIVRLDVPTTIGSISLVAVPLPDQTITLDLRPYSIRAAGYQLLVQGANGALVPHDPGPENTLRGEVWEMPDSSVHASVNEAGLHASIRMSDGGVWWIEPLFGRFPGATRDQHVVYRDTDVQRPGGLCGNVNIDAMPTAGDADEDGGAAGGGGNCGGLCIAELACDADREYFQFWGSVSAVQNRITSVINAVNNQYRNQVGIEHQITTIIVRTSEPDPYSSSDNDGLLCQFINEWTSNQQSIAFDVAKLFTGRDIDGNVIGRASNFGEICDRQGSCDGSGGGLDDGAFCFSQNDCCGTFACATDLASHELGHLWGAHHCNPCEGTTMHTPLQCANTFAQFSINEIVAHRNSRTCMCGSPTGCGNPVYVDSSAAGCEQGSASDPFDTVAEGIGYVCPGGAVNITAGTYPEAININQSMTLHAVGGTVNIRP
ncbi:MAG: hypothetical protein JNG88_10920 [Phycisphaerales bacterium]|nr:hypothetical protein [Phycisphaerales bacterium]